MTLPDSLSVPASVVGPGAAVNVTAHVPEVPLPEAVQLPVLLVVEPPSGVTLSEMLIADAVLV